MKTWWQKPCVTTSWEYLTASVYCKAEKGMICWLVACRNSWWRFHLLRFIFWLLRCNHMSQTPRG